MSLTFLLITSTYPWKLLVVIQPNTTQYITAQLDEGSYSRVFTNIPIFTYIIPVKCNVQIINGRKAPEKGFGIVMVYITKTNIIIPLWPSYYMLQNPQNTISKTALKYYNQFISVINEALIWLQIATDTGKKLKVETTVNEIYQQLLDLVTIDSIKIEQQHYSYQYIITLLMNPIINSSFKKYPMSWEIIHCRLSHPSDSVKKSTCCHQTLNGLPNTLS